MEDQVVAGTLDRIRNARSFLAFTIPTDVEDNVLCDIAAVLEPDILEDGTEGTDKEAIMRATADMLVRIWFENVTPADGPITTYLLIAEFKRNVTHTLRRVLEEKGLL
jgi:hypothetical protein